MKEFKKTLKQQALYTNKVLNIGEQTKMTTTATKNILILIIIVTLSIVILHQNNQINELNNDVENLQTYISEML